MTEARQVIVIGSGFGGAVAASVLAESGVAVTLLERGPWRDTVPTRSMGVERRVAFPRGWRLYTDFLRTLNVPYLPGGRITTNRHGLFELFYSPGIEVVCSSSVGGGSHVYSAVHARPADPAFWDGHAAGLSESEMRPHYESFFARMGSTVMTLDRRPPGHVAERFGNSDMVELVKPKVQVRVGFLLPDEAATPKKISTPSGIERWETDYASGDHGFLGSPSGAKTTLDFAYLAPAMKAGLQVLDLCEAITISRTPHGPGRYRVDYRDHRDGTRDASLFADHVVVAAGTMNTLRLLLASRASAETTGLAGMPQLGRRFSGNGDVRGLWDLDAPGSDLSKGLPSLGSIRLRESEEPAQALSNNSVPSVDSYPLPRFLRQRLKRSVVIAGMGEDAMDGVVDMSDGRMRIHFEPRNSPVYARIMRAFKTLSERSGRKVYAFKRPSTVHPLGGACIASTEDLGVVDGNGEVFGHPGLFVADAAAFPRSLGGPPTASIAAWASHVATRLAECIARDAEPTPSAAAQHPGGMNDQAAPPATTTPTPAQSPRRRALQKAQET